MRHSNNFDLIRLAAAFLVLESHAFALRGLTYEPVQELTGLGAGGWGVFTFFAISGYLVAKSWEADPHPLRFAARRALRIYPALIMVTLLTVFVLGPTMTTLPLADYFADKGTWAYLNTATGFKIAHTLPGVFDGNWYPSRVNGSLWTIPRELKLYCIVPFALIATWWLEHFPARQLLLGVVKMRPNKDVEPFPARQLLLGVAKMRPNKDLEPRSDAIRTEKALGPWPLLAAWGALFYVNQSVWPEYRPLLEFSTYFVFGMFIAALPERALPAVLWTGVVVLALGLELRSSSLDMRYFTAVCIPCLAIGLGVSREIAPALKRVGDLSYGTYIFAFPVQQIFMAYWPNAPVWASVVAPVPAILTLAWLSWTFVERPALTFKPRWKAAGAASEGRPAADFKQELAPAPGQ